jgi:CRP/FNR family transcriptional regulator, cyclic AMP receptor protein
MMPAAVPLRTGNRAAADMMGSRSQLWYLEQLGLFDQLTDEQRRALIGTTRTIEAKRGTRVYLPGDLSDRVYLVKSGVIRIVRQTADRREVVLAYLRAGDIFGELALVDDAPRDHVAEATEDAVLAEIARDTLLDLITAMPQVGLQIAKLIGLRLRRLEARVEELLGGSAQARLAQTLLQLAGEHGISDADGVLIPLRLSQGELGRLVGVRRETVNSILQEWRERGVVEVDRRTIRLRLPDVLRQMI